MIDDGKVEFHIHKTYLDMLSGLTGANEQQIIHMLYDIAQPVVNQVRSPDHKTHWTQRTFKLSRIPFPLSIKAKFEGFARNNKKGTVVCTFGFKKGKTMVFKQEAILNNIVEATLLGENNAT